MKKFQYSTQYGIDPLLSEIKDIDKQDYNEKIIFGIALYKKDDQLKPSFCRVEFLPKKKAIPNDIDYRYDDFIILRQSISHEEFYDVIDKVRNNEEISLSGLKFTINVGSWEASYVFSNQNWGYTDHEYPERYYQSQFMVETDGFIPNYPLAAKDYPPYPNGEKAIEHIFNLTNVGWSNLPRLFIITIPDYRSRIKSVKISHKKIVVKIDKMLSSVIMGLQYYISGNGSITTSKFKKITRNKVEIAVRKEPEEILIILMDEKGEIFDRKHVSMSYIPPDPSIRIATPSDNLRKIIEGGENKHIEFKSKVGEPERLMRSVVAFANTEGGRIFLGVSEDNGKIVGVKEPQNVKNTIHQWVGSYCDPKIDVNIRYSNELKIIIIEIPPGKQKPYFLQDEGVFLRVGATNRHATKAEWQSMVNTQENSSKADVAF